MIANLNITQGGKFDIKKELNKECLVVRDARKGDKYKLFGTIHSGKINIISLELQIICYDTFEVPPLKKEVDDKEDI